MARSLRNILKDPFIWIMISIYILCIFCVLVTTWTIYARVNTDDLHGQLFAARLMQVTLGMTIGLATTFLGIVTAWFGLEETSDIDASVGAAKARILAAGPGALLVVCGTFLVYVCITREFEYKSFQPIPYVKPLDEKPST